MTQSLWNSLVERIIWVIGYSRVLGVGDFVSVVTACHFSLLAFLCRFCRHFCKGLSRNTMAFHPKNSPECAGCIRPHSVGELFAWGKQIKNGGARVRLLGFGFQHKDSVTMRSLTMYICIWKLLVLRL